MNELYATSLDMVVAADAVWSALPARIDLLAAELQRTRRLAHSVGVRPGEHPSGDDLERITRTLTALREQVVSDPLAFWVPAQGSSAPGGGRPDTTVYDREARALEDVRREIEAVLTVRQDAEERLVRLRDVLSRADRTLAEARTARGEVLAKIAATEVPVVSGPPTALQEQLATAAEYRRHAQWHRLSPLLESLEEKAEDELLRARESLTAVTAPLAVRAELRGRLDAYKAKVARHGLAEDPLLIERYDAARRMLWSAPCDLRVAEQAVLRYQQAAAELLAAPRSRERGPRTGGGPGVSEGRSGMSSSVGGVSGQGGAPCQRPGCAGTYEDMGGGELYCDTCGLAPRSSKAWWLAADRVTGGGGARAAPRTTSRSSPGVSRASSPFRPVPALGVGAALPLGVGEVRRPLGVGARLGLGRGPSARGRLGAGLVVVPEVPRPDPRAMVLENPQVPERKRYCSRSDCGAPVGRARGERPGRTEGFCTKCGHPYSFVPKLRAGDIVHGQYEVAGCLAHGGLGWIYLAVDRAVSDRWVVLKGLLDTGDQDAMAAAISERRFLAEIEHADIVRIYNFVEHLDQRTGSLDGYIVMEYVGGKSLKEIANARRTPDGRRDPLPVEQACAYGIEALEALGHLHSRNLLYCDFKVDNAIQTEDQLKLIDMGAVRRMDDEESAIYGTVGYQAPEVADVGPSVASDLYTVGRTLAVLTFDFQGYTTVYADSLPDPDTIEVFRRTSPSTGSWCAPPTRTRPAGSPPPRRWRTS